MAVFSCEALKREDNQAMSNPTNKAIVLATNNANKKREYEEILSPLGYIVKTPKDLGIVSDPEETGSSYRENSYLKAKSLANKVSCPVIADDSGLEINALGKFPGIHSSRFASSYASYQEAWDVIFSRLQGNEDRSGQFVCCICYLKSPSDEPIYFEGICKGRILEEAKGNNGFGYDPIFHCDEANVNFGEAPEEIKNKYSHRAKASGELVKFLLDR